MSKEDHVNLFALSGYLCTGPNQDYLSQIHWWKDKFSVSKTQTTSILMIDLSSTDLPSLVCHASISCSLQITTSLASSRCSWINRKQTFDQLKMSKHPVNDIQQNRHACFEERNNLVMYDTEKENPLFFNLNLLYNLKLHELQMMRRI